MSAAQIRAPVTALASHQILQPMREKTARIERSGGSFGMELYGLDRELAMAEAFVGSVVEIDQRLFEMVRKGGGVDGVAMIVRGYDDRSVLQIFDRLIAAAMSVRQFEGFRAAGQRQQRNHSQYPVPHGGLERQVQPAGYAGDANVHCLHNKPG